MDAPFSTLQRILSANLKHMNGQRQERYRIDPLPRTFATELGITTLTPQGAELPFLSLAFEDNHPATARLSWCRSFSGWGSHNRMWLSKDHVLVSTEKGYGDYDGEPYPNRAPIFAPSLL